MTFAEAEQHIAWLRDWIGTQRLQRAIDEYHSDTRQVQGVHALRMKQRQPLVEAFADYLARTADGNLLGDFSDSLKDLGATAAIAYAIAPTIPDDLAEHQRHKLLNLDGQLHPLLLEWTTAGQIVRANHAELAWFPLGATSKRLPEFVARSPRTGVLCDIECKYQTANINQLLGSCEADTLAQTLIDHVFAANLCGDLSLTLANDPSQNTRQAHAAIIKHVAEIMPTQLHAGEGHLDLIEGASLKWGLKVCSGTRQ